ncbi:MAG: glycosyltransferase [Bacteroidota bacterium]
MHHCHLSILNPSQHTRIFHKMAKTMAAWGDRVSIIAQDEAAEAYSQDGIRINPLPPFHRLSLSRWKARKKLYQQALALEADVYWLHSPELLGVGKKLQDQLGAKIVYDVHEDYYLTLKMARHYPPLIRDVMANRVRSIEKKAVAWLAALTYAESCYDNMLEVPNEKKWIIRNTFSDQIPEVDTPLPKQPYFLISGTLAPEWGVMEGIRCWEKLYPHFPSRLVIAGFASRTTWLQQLRHRIHQSPYAPHIELIGGDTYVPYPRIWQLIQHCDAGLALYQVSPLVQDKIPTKFYSFLAAGRPLLYPETPTWREFGEKWGLGVCGATEMTGPTLHRAIQDFSPPERQASPLPYLWENDAQLLRTVRDQLAI